MLSDFINVYLWILFIKEGYFCALLNLQTCSGESIFYEHRQIPTFPIVPSLIYTSPKSSSTCFFPSDFSALCVWLPLSSLHASALPRVTSDVLIAESNRCFQSSSCWASATLVLRVIPYFLKPSFPLVSLNQETSKTSQARLCTLP